MKKELKEDFLINIAAPSRVLLQRRWRVQTNEESVAISILFVRWGILLVFPPSVFPNIGEDNNANDDDNLQ